MPAPENPRRSRALNVALGIAAAILLGGGLAWSVSQSSSKVTETSKGQVFDAEWIKLPTPQDVAAAYPLKARQAALREQALVEMRCIITEAGALAACTILHENMSGWGFGEAALALSDRFALKTKAKDGSSLVGLPVTVPLGFDPIFATPPAPTPRTTIS
jgi:hypothetical protein